MVERMPQPILHDEATAWQGMALTRHRPVANYHRQWLAYAWRWFVALGLVLSFVPGAAYTLWYCRAILHQSLVAAAVVSTWLLAALFCVWWQGQFRCPRCRRRYAALGDKRGSVNATFGLFDRVCANCHLKKFERDWTG